MRKWRVNAAIIGGAYLGEFEAENKEEAIEMALNEHDCTLCHQCADLISDPSIVDDSIEAEEVTE